MLSSLNPYNLREVKRGYEFTTDSGVEYEVYYLKSNFFDHIPEITVPILELQLAPIGEIPVGKSLLDSRIGDTVAKLVLDTVNGKNDVVIFICDCKDSREEQRWKKFNRWFARFDDGDVIKAEGMINAGSYIVYNGLFIHKEHSLRALVLSTFEELNNPELWKSPIS